MKITNEQIQKIDQFCKSRPEIIVAYLFGSQATGKAGPLSDVDLAFLIDSGRIEAESRGGYGYHAQLIAELMKLLGTNDVDVVILNEAPPLLKFKVINRGRVIFSRSEKERLAIHVKAFNEYQDFRPFLAVQGRYLVDRLKNTEGKGDAPGAPDGSNEQ
ncbi:MAG: nucleotidyltransferase domain-containing protein [Moorella sp. (in: Bacteria)]|nr:nucleotidyltransferase domain-containing protein [Moorella sp. (in: firmicutes)]